MIAAAHDSLSRIMRSTESGLQAHPPFFVSKTTKTHSAIQFKRQKQRRAF
jgi:hypothetical protein